MTTGDGATAPQEIWLVRTGAGHSTLTLDELDMAYQRGDVDASTLVFTAGMADWETLGAAAGIVEQPEQLLSGLRPASGRAARWIAGAGRRWRGALAGLAALLQRSSEVGGSRRILAGPILSCLASGVFVYALCQSRGEASESPRLIRARAVGEGVEPAPAPASLAPPSTYARDADARGSSAVVLPDARVPAAAPPSAVEPARVERGRGRGRGKAAGDASSERARRRRSARSGLR